ncbi:TIGR02099 family protein [Undibacterium sp. Jales W-56]|uniref:YhdP family protein n=1 Tax=Undibacterium sp. Jales W-56 TaxID=2897325 RepID=UPI0021D22550|nr:YhdP family protein [Undibacterium sp. Jales W-56]MCU6435522.1 TIGR02099 family protein [Undibacterium sp. Jales W-56]
MSVINNTPVPPVQDQVSASIPDAIPASDIREVSNLGRLRALMAGCRSATAVCGRGVRVLLKLLALCYFLFCALFLALRYGVLPNVAHYKADIEKFASQSIGRPVEITNLQASWSRLNPVLVLQDVVVRDQKGQPALTLPDVSATVSWWSLLLLELRLDKLDIAHPSLTVQKLADGKLLVGGFFIDPAQAGDGKGLDWILAQRDIVIRDGSLRWIDQYRNAPELNLASINFVLNNQWRHHKFALKATPPADLAAPVDIRGDFQHAVFNRRTTELSSWSGDLYADLAQSDLSLLKAYVDLPADVKKAHGTVRAWLHLDKGRVAELTADIKLTDVLGTFRKDLPVLDMAQVSGRLIASERAAFGRQYLRGLFGQAGHKISLIDFSMQTRDGQVLPATTISESYVPAQKGQPEKVELFAKQLDLHTLANFAEHLPLPPDQRRMLADFGPRGQLKEFTAKWQGSYPEIVSYSLKGQFLNLSLQAQPAQLALAKTSTAPARAAVPAIPGFENLSGTVDASDKGGSFMLDSKDLSLQLSSYFVDPVMPFKKLQMLARWQFEADDKLALQISKMAFEQDKLVASISGKYTMSMRPGKAQGQDAQPGEVDIVGKLTGFDLKQIDRFIPVNAPEDLRRWLIGALLDGRADDVSLRIQGDLAQFPFAAHEGKSNPKGEFWVKGAIVDGKLDFSPGYLAEDGKAPLWPVIDSIKGSFVFDRARMEIRGDTAKTLGADLSKVKAIIPDLVNHNSVLTIDGTASGNLQTMLQYVNASPVDGWLGHFLKDSKASANAQLGLKLQLPLQHIVESKVQGLLQFAGNDLQLQGGIPAVSAVNGKLEFTEKGVSLNTLKGTLLGGAVQATGGSQKDGSIRIRLDGVATADGLRKNFPALASERLSDKLLGAARYSASINVKKRQLELQIDSSLQGLALNFPAPLRKTANDSLPLHFELVPQVAADANQLRDEIKVNLGTAINARYQRQKSTESNASWQVLRGGIGVNAPAPEPDSGLNANIDFKAVNVDEWRRLVATANNAAANAGAGLGANSATSAGDLDIAAYIEPNVLAARTAELTVMGKKLDNVVVGASHQKGLWQANIDSNQASGYLSWSDSGIAGQGLGNVSARLSKLIIPQSAASDVSDLLEGKNSDTQIPSLDIAADNFELFNKKFGRLEMMASNAMTATGREWRIHKVSLKNEDAELKGSGKWSNRSGASVTDLNYVLEINSAGKLLDRVGFANVMRGGRGKLQGEVTWNGLPFSMDVPSMSGQIQLELAAGQFLKVDPGAAKLLGVLSMQSLPRRLTLDFRDVFSDGFAFDSITGTAQIQKGIAKTENLKMRSVNATVLMDGTADIVNESQHLHVAVIPEINAGTASVVYGLAVNPVIGLGTFLAQLFLREPLARAFTYEYMITGEWKEPTVTKIDHKDVEIPPPKKDSGATK